MVDGTWLSRRALRLHVTAVVVIVTFLALGRWQLHRALSGNMLSWAYTVEWPLFAALAVLAWWRLVHDPPPDPVLAVRAAEVTIGPTTFDRVAYDAAADALYLRVDGARTDTDARLSPEGHRLRIDEDGRLVGLTVVGARRMLEQRKPIVITAGQPIDVHLAVLADALTPHGSGPLSIELLTGPTHDPELH